MRSLGADKSVKVHQGFQKRADIWKRLLVVKLNDQRYQSVGKVVTCGHSLGAAIAAMVHLEFVSDQALGSKEFVNITFALPMFGNLALKRFLLESNIQICQKMHHFVNPADIIPAACFIQNAQQEGATRLGSQSYGLVKQWGLSIGRNVAPETFLDYFLKSFLKTLPAEEKADFIRNFNYEFKIRNQNPEKLVANNKPEVCMPIGKYLIFHEGKLYDYPDDHQWIAQTLLTSLRTENAQIENEHSIENYGNQLAKCYGDFENFDAWKTETDGTLLQMSGKYAPFEAELPIATILEDKIVQNAYLCSKRAYR